ncbi:DUF2058 family protein [Geopsychrobacter electrodiphilus]|uniref:DUF2058 family protein n=1 Tax=Geopsychrobacter electrodiphilus TaxID=225196 RepID=UPI00038276C1|nr:DUF2058 family protein [Geopsychrobacter electrodiphilus]
MGLSLQEQLLKAGLVDKKQIKQADHAKRVQAKMKRKAGDSFEDRDALRLQQQQIERAKQDQQLNAERNQRAQQKAAQAAAQQLIEANCMRLEEGEVVYHYVSGGKIKRVAVGPEVADQLAEGRLGLAMSKSGLVLLSAETVKKVLNRDPDAILAYNDPTKSKDDYPTDW